MTRALLTTIFLTLLSQTAWAVDCKYLQKEVDKRVELHKYAKQYADEKLAEYRDVPPIKIPKYIWDTMRDNDARGEEALQEARTFAELYLAFCK